MAIAARRPVGSFVDIVFPVTAVASFWRHNFLRMFLCVARVARNRRVLSSKRISRLLSVIIPPLLPIGGVVAVLALWT